MTFGEFLFHNLDRRRHRTEALHDILIAAKNGCGRTQIMYDSHLSWIPMTKLLEIAESGGLIEEFKISPYYSRKKPKSGWKTTEKGLKYAQGVYDNYALCFGRPRDDD